MRLTGAPRAGAAGVIELPMTSMIDVVFLLLIFFMVTASFAEPEDRLPSTVVAQSRAAAASPLQPQVVRVGLGVGGEAVFTIGGSSVRTREELTAVLGRLPKEPGVVVRVDDRAPIWAAAAALQAAQDAGFTKRTYAAGDAGVAGPGGVGGGVGGDIGGGP